MIVISNKIQCESTEFMHAPCVERRCEMVKYIAMEIASVACAWV